MDEARKAGFVPLTVLKRRVSAKGKTYFVGRLGGALVVLYEQADGETFNLFLRERTEE